MRERTDDSQAVLSEALAAAANAHWVERGIVNVDKSS